MVLTILTLPTDTIPFAKTVSNAADSDRKALGFIAKSVYGEMCALGRVFVAVTTNAGGAREYVGHVMFGGASSELDIHQLHVSKSRRRSGVARALIDAVVEWAESRSYLGIAARVAMDLSDSNLTWERLGFRFVRRVAGGKS